MTYTRNFEVRLYYIKIYWTRCSVDSEAQFPGEEGGGANHREGRGPPVPEVLRKLHVPWILDFVPAMIISKTNSSLEFRFC